MTEKAIRNKLKELIKPHLQELYFPDGIYGGTVYSLDEEGFLGPHHIPDYVVPVCFSSEALSKFHQKLAAYKKDIKSIDDSEIESILEGIDLKYGDRWDLEPEKFLEMVEAGCEADRYYLLDSSIGFDEPEDFFYFLEEGIYATYSLEKWSDLELEDVENWCEMLIESNKTED